MIGFAWTLRREWRVGEELLAVRPQLPARGEGGARLLGIPLGRRLRRHLGRSSVLF